MDRIYLDNAATSWPKPETVYAAVDRYQREVGAAAGRGSYSSAQAAQQIVDTTRAACARLLGVADPRRVVFTSNGTASLNLAIHGLLGPGDHVVTTVCEHNSVLRPLHWQAEHNDVQLTHVGCDGAGYVDSDDVRAALQPNTKLVAITHASNVTGALQPVADIGRIAREADAFVLVDAAQTAGCVPIDAEALDVDLLACGGHKGLLGPLGTGLLYVRPGVEQQLHAISQGGTGVDSHSAAQPDQLPEKLEVGNLNLPAIAGLGAAVDFLQAESVDKIHQHHHTLTERLLEKLQGTTGIRVYGPTANQPRVAVISCSVEGYDPHEFASAIDLIAGVECRAGFHCAPRMHAALGTEKQGGLVRFSPGWSTTLDDIEMACVPIAVAAENVPH